MTAAVEHARQEWAESHLRLQAEPNSARLLEQVEAVATELRRRVGETFTLAELADAYAGAERWSRDVVAEMSPPPGWLRTLALVEGAAFHRYARGAVDYAP